MSWYKKLRRASKCMTLGGLGSTLGEFFEHSFFLPTLELSLMLIISIIMIIVGVLVLASKK